MRLFTAQIGYSGTSQQVVVDTTVKSSKGSAQVLAPTWKLVMGHKKGLITWEQYTEGYLDLMRRRYNLPHQRERMLDFLHIPEDVVFCCYCNEWKYPQCHRFLLVDIYEKLAEKFGVQFIYDGELGRGH